MTSVFLAEDGNHLSKSELWRTPLYSSIQVFERSNMVMQNDLLNAIIFQEGRNKDLFSGSVCTVSSRRLVTPFFFFFAVERVAYVSE